MKVLVTGANGFLGSALTKKLCSNKDLEVHCLLRSNSDTSEIQNLNYKTILGDVTDLSSLMAALSGIDTVFHLAGVVAYRKADLPLMEKVNVGGTQNIVMAALEKKARRFVHISSVTAVGAGFSPQQILNENSDFNVGHLHLGYFDTKHAAENFVKKACFENDLNAVIVNPSTIYGFADAKKGSRKMQLKVARGQFKYYTSGGVSVVDVDDVVDGILSAWTKGRQGERYILSGDNLYIKDLFALIAKHSGVPAPDRLLPGWFLHGAGFVGDVLEKVGLSSPISSENAWTSTLFHWFDHAKATRELNFQPRPASEAIAKSVQWIKQNGLLGY
ncbi:MAG: NAD-dependent epimerase/dehydratase family protein [Pseudobdellovibrionaceae bacterium]